MERPLFELVRFDASSEWRECEGWFSIPDALQGGPDREWQVWRWIRSPDGTLVVVPADDGPRQAAAAGVAVERDEEG